MTPRRCQDMFAMIKLVSLVMRTYEFHFFRQNMPASHSLKHLSDEVAPSASYVDGMSSQYGYLEFCFFAPIDFLRR